MEAEYLVTFKYNDGRIEKVNVKSELEANSLASERLSNDPNCCAEMTITEFNKENPNKQWISLRRFEIVNGRVVNRIMW